MGIVEGAAAVIIGLLLGRFLPARRKGPQASGPVCGCGHHHSFHDPETGRCHSLVYVPGTMSQESRREPCRCKQYSGPVAYPQFYAPEITAEGQ